MLFCLQINKTELKIVANVKAADVLTQKHYRGHILLCSSNWDTASRKSQVTSRQRRL